MVENAEDSLATKLPYGSFTPKQNAKQLTSTFYMVSNTSHQHLGITLLLQHFGWRWVGLLVTDDDDGEHFLQVLEPQLSQSEICLAFTERIANKPHFNSIYDIFSVVSSIHETLTDSKANVIVLYGDSVAIPLLILRLLCGNPNYKENTSLMKVWVLTAQTDFVAINFHGEFDFEYFHGAISLKSHSNELLEFQKFLQDIKPPGKHGDGFFRDFWEQAFDCTFPNTLEPRDGPDTCTGRERLESLSESVFRMRMTGHSYTIYNALYAVGHALQLIYSSRARQRLMRGRGRTELQDVKPWQVHSFLQDIAFNNTAGETVSFNKNRGMGARLEIMNLVTFPNKSFRSVNIGRVDPNSIKGEEFLIHDEMIVWPGRFNKNYVERLSYHPRHPDSFRLKLETDAGKVELADRIRPNCSSAEIRQFGEFQTAKGPTLPSLNYARSESQ
uniref:Uncharacterized protein n=1 Tax=Sphaerodactylus townsendi TaxID=933632 RepID=A0ACB8EW10_9SAUR